MHESCVHSGGVLQDPTCSKFYINGYSRFHQRARLFAVASAISSRVPEGFQARLMEGPRVASVYDELWAAASKELRYVIDIADDMWKSLAVVAGCSAGELRDRAIGAAHISYHFIWRRVLEPAAQLPWRLCRGDVDDNLDEIAAMDDEPSEPCTKQLWFLLQGEEVERSQLKMLVELFGECSWSSLPAEQQHGSLSLLHRWHPEYGLESLVSRALLHQAVRLIPRQSALDKKITKVMNKISKVERANPDKATGSHMLVAALVHVMKQRKD